MNPVKNPTQDPVTQADFRIPVLVNRKRAIATAEDKANVTGFQWSRPKEFPQGFVERRNKRGEFLDYRLIEPITIHDVDGRAKHTIKTTYYEADKRTLKDKPKPAFGVWVDGLGGKYNGKLSRNWKQEQLTLSEIISELNAGFSIAPGLFTPPKNQSRRSSEHIQHRLIILLDGDEWTAEHPAPPNLDELIIRYPDIPQDFYWVGESINSRTYLKPELRTRLMLVLPEPIHKGQIDLWETCIDWVATKYPFIARGVGIDKVRLSFGNARTECENRVLGGIVSRDTFTEWKQTARDKEAKAEALRIETENKKAENAKRRAEKQAVTTELKRRGHAITENKDPLREFCEVNPETLLTRYGLASLLSGDTWNWHEGSQGRSFELVKSPHVGWAMRIYSGTMQRSHPDTDPTDAVGAHRFILYHLHGLDMKKDTDKRPLRCILANEGYGTHPDDYKQAKRIETVAGVREGLVSPLELRRSEPPLPTENRAGRILQTLEKNEPEIKKAFSQKARVVGLRGGTGDGKTESVIIEAKDGRRVAMTVPTLPVAEQINDRFLDAKCGAMLWQSRFYGYNEKHKENDERLTPDAPLEERVRAFDNGEVICVDPVKCKASQKRGIPAPVGVCSTCPVQADCNATGYLSQIPAAQFTHVLTIAQPKLFIDPAFAGFFSQMAKKQPKKRLHVIDEAKAHDLFIDCELHKDRLQQWVQDWQGEKLGIFAELVLSLLEVKTAEPYAIAEMVNAFDDDDISDMARQASRFSVSYTRTQRLKLDPDTDDVLAKHGVQFQNQGFAYIAVDFDAYKRLLELGEPAMQPSEISDTGHMELTANQAFRFGIYRNETTDDFQEIPRIYESEKWTCFQQLKSFANRYQRADDAPIWYDTKSGVLHWAIAPVLHHRVNHLVCMSATLQKTAFKRAFDPIPVEFIETPSTHWVKGAKAFQVRSGKYSRATILEREHGTFGEVKGLSDTGKYFGNLIETEMERDRNVKHVIITVNAIVDIHRVELLKRHGNLIDVHSFHAMEGLDYTENGLVFWVLGCPDVELDVVRNQAKVIYGNDTEPLNYEYDKASGTFVDERLHQCWQAVVSDLLKQAVGRPRLNRLANTAFVFSNVLIPDFTFRAVGCVPQDLEVAGGLESLDTVAKQRRAVENKTGKTHKETRQEREQNRQSKRDAKKKKKLEVCRLYNAGMSKTGIKERTGISRPTIDAYLAEQSF